MVQLNIGHNKALVQEEESAKNFTINLGEKMFGSDRSSSSLVAISIFFFSGIASAKTQFPPGETFYWQLSEAVNTGFQARVYDIDLENNEHNGLIDRLQRDDKKVICYFSAGTWEPDRSDSSRFPSNTIGRRMQDWPKEKWLDIRDSRVRALMQKRMERAKEAGCDAIEPDNLDSYAHNTGFQLSKSDSLDFLDWLSQAASALDIAIGLKNTEDLVIPGRLYEKFDFAIKEECFLYNECEAFNPFIKAGKAVYIAEYKKRFSKKCSIAKTNRWSLSIFHLDLNGRNVQICQ